MVRNLKHYGVVYAYDEYSGKFYGWIFVKNANEKAIEEAGGLKGLAALYGIHLKIVVAINLFRRQLTLFKKEGPTMLYMKDTARDYLWPTSPRARILNTSVVEFSYVRDNLRMLAEVDVSDPAYQNWDTDLIGLPGD